MQHTLDKHTHIYIYKYYQKQLNSACKTKTQEMIRGNKRRTSSMYSHNGEDN
jgi:hypothetical protein